MIIVDRVYFDDLNHAVRVPHSVNRIVSLCPSITETLFSFDLGDKVVGRTRYCIKPQEVKKISVVGGTKDVDILKVLALKPDMVFSAKEENEKKHIQAIAKEVPTFVFDVRSFGDAMRMILSLGKIFNNTSKADEMVVAIEERFAGLSVVHPAKSFLYAVWKDPFMVAGRHTFIDSMMSVLGLVNAVPTQLGSYPILDNQGPILNPDLIILPDEPYPFTLNDVDEISRMFPDARIVQIDGQMSSWFGSRMIHSPGYFERWIQRLKCGKG